jgi:hypothetical protein
MPLAPLPRSLLRSAMRFNRGCPGYPPLSPVACRATSRVMGNLYPRMLHFIWRKSLGRLDSDRTAPAAWGRDYLHAMAVEKFLYGKEASVLYFPCRRIELPLDEPLAGDGEKRRDF